MLQFLWPGAGNLASLPLFQFGLSLNFFATLPLKLTLNSIKIIRELVLDLRFFKFRAELLQISNIL